MNILGLSITRAKATDMVTRVPTEMVSASAGFFGRLFGGHIHEPFTGAWQRNIEWNTPEIWHQSTVWSCVTRIASDIAKIGVELVERTNDQIWVVTENPAYSPVLRVPNHFQDPIQFFEYWVLSKLTHGNTYVLKERDGRGVVTRLYILDPTRVRVLVAANGSIYYELSSDNLSGLEDQVRVPASEIIHDRGPTLNHPLCGLSPIVAAGLPAWQSLKIQFSSAKHFQNNSKPGGVLTAPHQISNETAERIQRHWESNFAGEDNVGKVAVLGDGLTYEPMAVTAVESQLIDQLKWSDERICACFGVPPFMVGVGAMPGDQNAERLVSLYFSQCLQVLIEKIERCLDFGLSLPPYLDVRFDIENLIRMDATTKMKIATDGVMGGIFSPNHARGHYYNLPPTAGGGSPMMQQQQWALEDLAKRRELMIAPKPLTPLTAIDQPDDGGEDGETKSSEYSEQMAYETAKAELAA